MSPKDQTIHDHVRALHAALVHRVGLDPGPAQETPLVLALWAAMECVYEEGRAEGLKEVGQQALTPSTN